MADKINLGEAATIVDPIVLMKTVEGSVRACFENAIAGVPYKKNPIILVLGGPGIGKSNIVEQAVAKVANDEEFMERIAEGMAAMTGEEIDPDIMFRVVMAAQYEQADFGGLPWPDANGEMSRLRPFFLPKAGLNTLFFDEVTKADEGIPGVLAQLTLDGCIGEHFCSPATAVILAGNERQHMSGDKELPKFLLNRVVVLTLEPKVKLFLDFAARQQFDHRVQSFIAFEGNHQYFNDFNPQFRANPTPRAWEKVSDILKSGFFDKLALLSMIHGTVGPSAGAAFVNWMKIEEELVPTKDIFDDPKNAPIPDRPEAQWLQMSALARAVERKHTDALNIYLKRFEEGDANRREISVFCLNMIFGREANNPKGWQSVLLGTQGGTEILERYAELLLD